MRASFRALGAVLSNPSLRRLQLAWAGSILGGWAYLVALGVYAYEQGGAGAVGHRRADPARPGAIVAPFSATLVDRFSRVTTMIVSDVVRFTLMIGAAAVIATDGPPPIVYGLVALSTIAGTVFRPAQAALLPSLVASPAELTAANVASSTIESIGTFLGPALGGLLLAVSDPAVVFAANGATFLWSAALVFGLRGREQAARAAGARRRCRRRRRRGRAPACSPGSRRSRESRPSGRSSGSMRRRPWSRARSTCSSSSRRSSCSTSTRRVSGSSTPRSASAGSSAGSWRSSCRRADGWRGTSPGGLALFGLPLLVLGGLPFAVIAVVALGVLGIGNSIVDVNALTIMQRAVPDAVLGRALGALDGLLIGTLGLGAVAAPLLIDLVGPEAALVVTGAVLPVLALLSRPRLRAIDRMSSAPEATGLLRGVPLLSALPEPLIERLAREATPVEVRAGVPIVREGEPGDRFYVVRSGQVSILGRTFGPGEAFGEIALLRNVPRTATAVAVTDVELVALEREPFVAAVTGHAPSAAAADTVIAARLGSLSAGSARV